MYDPPGKYPERVPGAEKGELGIKAPFAPGEPDTALTPLICCGDVAGEKATPLALSLEEFRELAAGGEPIGPKSCLGFIGVV